MDFSNLLNTIDSLLLTNFLSFFEIGFLMFLFYESIKSDNNFLNLQNTVEILQQRLEMKADEEKNLQKTVKKLSEEVENIKNWQTDVKLSKHLTDSRIDSIKTELKKLTTQVTEDIGNSTIGFYKQVEDLETKFEVVESKIQSVEKEVKNLDKKFVYKTNFYKNLNRLYNFELFAINCTNYFKNNEINKQFLFDQINLIKEKKGDANLEEIDVLTKTLGNFDGRLSKLENEFLEFQKNNFFNFNTFDENDFDN